MDRSNRGEIGYGVRKEASGSGESQPWPMPRLKFILFFLPPTILFRAKVEDIYFTQLIGPHTSYVLMLFWCYLVLCSREESSIVTRTLV